jgi:DNA-3-methyladenine glycosylase II
LYSTIVKQQLSIRVGNVLLKRFLAIYHDHEPVSEEVVATPFETLRGIGLSKSKATYIKNVAAFDLEQGLEQEKLDVMSDKEIIDYITAIKGIGRWTAHLFLIAALAREDVFPADDLILQKAVAGIYGLDRSDKKMFLKAMNDISVRWSPFRSYASLHLWKWKPDIE